jgi:hypothetical protein
MENFNVSEKLTKERSEYEIKKQLEYHLSQRFRKVPGLKLYEFDTDTMTLTEVHPEIIAELDTRGNTIKREKVKVSPENLYIQAHCYRTAMSKINKILKNLMGVEQFFDTKYYKNGKPVQKDTAIN